MHVGLKDASTEDGKGVTNVADRMAGKRLDIGPLCVAGRHDLQPADPVVQKG